MRALIVTVVTRSVLAILRTFHARELCSCRQAGGREVHNRLTRDRLLNRHRQRLERPPAGPKAAP